MDLSRAFDTISHDILLNKLYKYGIRGLSSDWIKSYLSNRKQYVNYKNSSSDTLNVNIGIPQGSILGPFLFILYINDLHNVSDKLTLLQFADDSSFFVSGRSLPELFNVLQNEIVKIREWLNNNKLSLNISKTNYMIMTNRKKVIFNCQMMDKPFLK